MIYIVLGGTLNPTHSLTHSGCFFTCCQHYMPLECMCLMPDLNDSFHFVSVHMLISLNFAEPEH